MPITNETELILALRERGDKYGVVTGLSPTTTKDIFKFIEKQGFVSTVITKSSNYIKKIKLDEFNAYLESFDLYYEAKGLNTEKTMVWYLKSFGALEEGKFMFRRVYSKNEAKRISEGDPLAVDQKAMRKRLTRLATIAGKEVTDYVTEDLGLEIDFEERPFRRGMSPTAAKTDVKKVIEDMVSSGRKITKADKYNSSQKLTAHGVERVDANLSPFNDFMINTVGKTPEGNIRIKTDKGFELLVDDIISTWPEGIITGVQDTPQNALVYGRMKQYYYGTPHDKHITFSQFWSIVFNVTPKLHRYTFARTNDDPNKLEKRAALVERALQSPTIYTDDNGVKHMRGIFNDRKNYNILRSEAKMLGLTLEEYMYKHHGIIVDVVKKQKYETLGSRIIKASDYKKPDTLSSDGNTEGM